MSLPCHKDSRYTILRRSWMKVYTEENVTILLLPGTEAIC